MEKRGLRNLQWKLKKGAYCVLMSTLSFYVSYENGDFYFQRIRIIDFKSVTEAFLNCSDLLWEKIVVVIEKNFWNSRLKAENFQNFEVTCTIYSSSESSEHFFGNTLSPTIRA